MIYFVDLQGFKTSSNNFIVKEIAILCNNNYIFHHFIIKPPCKFKNLNEEEQKQIKWLEHHHHGLQWSAGHTTYGAVQQFLLNKLRSEVVYVKGAEKKLWLEHMMPNITTVYNLEDSNYPSLQTLGKLYTNTQTCRQHRGCCALQNVFLVANYFLPTSNKFHVYHLPNYHLSQLFPINLLDNSAVKYRLIYC